MITIEKSEKLLDGLDTFYKAILPSAEYQRKKNFQIMATEEDSFHRNVTKPFLDYMRLKIIQDIRRAVIKAKTTPTIFTEFVDWEDVKTKGKLYSKPAYVKILDKSGTQATVIARVEAGFDVMNVNSIKWAEKYSAAMVTEVTKETKKALREVISDGMKQKWNKLKIARKINKLPIGLNVPQTQALHNFRDKLISDGVSAKLVEKRVQSYYNRLLRQRSRAIARTETARAVNEGYLQGLEQQKVYNYVKISMAADACHLCTEHEGRVFTIHEAHAFLPIHVHCRCAWVVVYAKKPSFMPPLAKPPTSEEARESLEGYQDGGFQKVNGYLRGEEIDPNFIKRTKIDIRNMDFLAKPSVDDYYLYRGDGAGISANLFEKLSGLPHNIPADKVLLGKINGKTYTEFLNNKLKGMTFTDNAFISTSKNMKLAMENFVGGSTSFSKHGSQGFAEIMVKKGTKLIDVEKVSLMGAGESEMILARGLKYKIENVLIKPYQYEGRETRFYIKYILSIVE